MPFPLPLDPEFRLEIVQAWLEDVEDRIETEDLEGAKESWRLARELYLGLPPGFGKDVLEQNMLRLGVKFD